VQEGGQAETSGAGPGLGLEQGLKLSDGNRRKLTQEQRSVVAAVLRHNGLDTVGVNDQIKSGVLSAWRAEDVRCIYETNAQAT